MDNLSNSVYNYYCSHFEELTFDKQLHFASRLFLWSDDIFGKTQLDRLRARVTSNDDAAVSLQDVYTTAQQTIHHGSKNAAALRAPYFEKYPQLRTVAMLLFRTTFLKTIYRLDARDTLFKIFPKTEIDSMVQLLLADPDAISILSTHAINVLYLYSRIVLEDDTLFDPAQFLELGERTYDLDDPIQLQLYIYLYTHCVIGESHFYAHPVPDTYRSIYRQMLDNLERVIDTRFTAVNLDNKFEFLVCCTLIGKDSYLKDRVEAEAVQSISDSGTFLVDRHNTNPQTANSTLDLSEHRNVLYILSHREPMLRG